MELTLPLFNYNVKKHQGVLYIFDVIRKKYIVLTKEEWVRQHVIHYLIRNKGYPRTLINVEKSVHINGLYRRFDVICFNRQALPLLLVECKAPEVILSQAVFDQVFEYNSVLGAKYVAVTNGSTYFCGGKTASGKFAFRKDIPSFK